jgi:alkanesulfonate monooxygenase SsuD/methylene tetrahydromethanopterin reductase-like flavin-dependent oxidoreductase (luciferase family)
MFKVAATARVEDAPGFRRMFAANRLVPKPIGRLPLLVTGNSGQPLPWIAAHSDGWISYPRSIEGQAETVARWRAQVEAAAPGRFKPFAQSLYVDHVILNLTRPARPPPRALSREPSHGATP